MTPVKSKYFSICVWFFLFFYFDYRFKWAVCLLYSLRKQDGKSESVIQSRTDSTMAKRKKTDNDLQNSTQKTKDRGTPEVNSSAPEGWAVPVALVTSDKISGHVWHRYSITVNQVMVATVKLSKWWFHLNQYEPLVQ